jgi:RNA polymerase sigma-70 factor (ECF subfamily)
MERNGTEELLLALQGKLWKDAYSLTWDRNRADDLLQETFTRALCNAGSFSGSSQDFTKWTHAIMHNAFLNNVKKEQHLCHVNDTFLATTFGDKECDEGLQVNDIYSAIDSLPGNAGKVMRLYVSGHKYGEISIIMEIPLGTVKTRISQARAILKEQLKDYLC